MPTRVLPKMSRLLFWYEYNTIKKTFPPFDCNNSLSTAEFPEEGGGDVLHGGPEQRGGDVQQRLSRSGAGGVPSSAGGEGSTQRLHQVPSSAGH